MSVIILPVKEEQRIILYCKMLGLPVNNRLTYEELEYLCLKRGYLSIEKKEMQKKEGVSE